MAGNKKKGLVCCDYCQHEKDAKGMYTTRMQFAGIKIAEVLQIVGQRKVPLSTPINLCAVCISTLHATTGTIERTVQMVSNLLETSNDGKLESGNFLSVESEVEVVEPPAKTVTKATRTSAKMLITKEQKVVAGSPSKASPGPSGKQLQPKVTKEQQTLEAANAPTDSPKKQPKVTKDQKSLVAADTPTTDSPKKQSKSLQATFKDNLDDSLKDVIKLTPAKEVSKKSKAIIQLFGSSANHASDSDGDSDNSDIIEIPDTKTSGFECELCDFKTNFGGQLKRHMRDNHGKKRPRIFKCTKCPKAYGVLMTLNTHMKTHATDGEDDDDDDDGGEEPQIDKSIHLAKLTALKPPAAKKTNDAEYTFAIKNSNSSTPKPNDGQKKEQAQLFTCDVCKFQLTSAKGMQDHMKTLHLIEKPRIFKCEECVATFMHKTGLNRHVATKHNGEQPKVATKLPARRGTIDLQPSLIQNEKKPTQIVARRKTVCAQVIEESQLKLDTSKPLATPSKATDAVDQIEIKASESPKKKPSKQTEDDVISSLLDDVFDTNGSPTKKKMKQTKIDDLVLNDTAMEETFTNSPNKKAKTKKGVDTRDTTPKTPVVNGTPNKSPKQKGVHTRDATPKTPLVNGTPKKSEKRKSAQVETGMEDEEMQSSPSKKSKRIKTESLQLDGEEQLELQHSPLKKSKLDNRKKSECEIIEVLEEINTNPLPHKRDLLESQDNSDTQSPISCSQCTKVVSSRKRLDSHMKKKHKTFLDCRKCEQNFPGSEEFVNHFDNCDKSGGLQCGVKNCDKAFASPEYLSTHIKKKHKLN